MKKILSFAVLIVIFMNYSFSKKVENCIFQDKSPETILKGFYSEYITECRKNTPVNNMDLVLKKYVTTNLLNKIEKRDLDYDPFVNAQDCDQNFLNTFRVKKDTKKANTFVVSYLSSYTRKTITITLVVEKFKNSYKIGDIKGI